MSDACSRKVEFIKQPFPDEGLFLSQQKTHKRHLHHARCLESGGGTKKELGLAQTFQNDEIPHNALEK